MVRHLSLVSCTSIRDFCYVSFAPSKADAISPMRMLSSSIARHFLPRSESRFKAWFVASMSRSRRAFRLSATLLGDVPGTQHNTRRIRRYVWPCGRTEEKKKPWKVLGYKRAVGVVCRRRHGQRQVVELGRKRVSCTERRCLEFADNGRHSWRSVNTTPFVSSWADGV